MDNIRNKVLSDYGEDDYNACQNYMENEKQVADEIDTNNLEDVGNNQFNNFKKHLQYLICRSWSYLAITASILTIVFGSDLYFKMKRWWQVGFRKTQSQLREMIVDRCLDDFQKFDIIVKGNRDHTWKKYEMSDEEIKSFLDGLNFIQKNAQ